jgi:hypothetical protein
VTVDPADLFAKVATTAVGAYIAFAARWYTIEKPERSRMEREAQRRELEKLDEVEEAARDRPR